MKTLVKNWYDKRPSWHYAPIQNGMGEHGIHDSCGWDSRDCHTTDGGQGDFGFIRVNGILCRVIEEYPVLSWDKKGRELRYVAVRVEYDAPLQP